LTLRDPAGLLDRSPELKPLCEQHAGLRKALESGDPFKVYRALWKVRLLGGLPQYRDVVQLLTSRRRLFALPLEGRPPGLFTLNSVGLAFVGSSERESDGSYITTHCAVMLFKVPLFPLGAYVVLDDGSGWRIFARVPLGPVGWISSRVLAIAALLAVAMGGMQLLDDSRHRELWVVNGYGQPISVEIAGQRAVVEPGSHAQLRLQAGKHQARATLEEGDELSSESIDLQASDRTRVWNPGGLAPVYLMQLVYVADKETPPATPAPQFFCGQSVIDLGNVDYPFEEPPEKLKAGSWRSQLSVARRTDPAVCMEVLLDQGKGAQVTPLLERVGRSRRWKVDDLPGLLWQAAVGDLEGAARLAQEAFAARPDELELARTHQGLELALGRREQQLQEAQQRLKELPEGLMGHYLLARLARGESVRAAAEALVERFPEEPWALEGLVRARAGAEDWPGTLEAWTRLVRADAELAERVFDHQLEALVRQKRTSEARELIRQRFKDRLGARPDLAALYARVAALEGKGDDAEALLALLKEDEPRTFARARAGLPAGKGEEPSQVEELLLTLVEDPAVALEKAAALPLSDLQLLYGQPWPLLYGEAARTRHAAAERLSRSCWSLDPDDLALFERYVRGEPVKLQRHDFNSHQLAAAHFVRSRNPGLPAAERARLVAEARRLDPLHTFVTQAIGSWNSAADR
jgi:hypothetical protein